MKVCSSKLLSRWRNGEDVRSESREVVSPFVLRISHGSSLCRELFILNFQLACAACHNATAQQGMKRSVGVPSTSEACLSTPSFATASRPVALCFSGGSTGTVRLELLGSG